PAGSVKETADVVVIGAGIQGLSAAWHLAKFGIRDVALVEKSTVGSGSSRWSASMLMMQLWEEWQLRFSPYNYARYAAFEEDTGFDPGFVRTGTLTLVTPDMAEEERRLVVLRRKYGANTQILTPQELGRWLPVLATRELAFGVLGPEDGVLDTPNILRGWRQSAQQMGVNIHENRRATGLAWKAGRIEAVQTTTGPIATRTIVNAAGADAQEVGSWAGLQIPSRNRVRNIFLIETPVEIDFHGLVNDAATHWYFRRSGEVVMVGHGARENAPVQAEADMDFWPDVRAICELRAPALAKGPVSGGWSGTRPLTPDGSPILGPVAQVPGFINNCGWGGEGIMNAPVGGQLVAEQICNGRTSTFDVTPFLLERFDAEASTKC
ncbi:MAG: FAD-binding oxidoreductase, partial [Anaerolineaceae bacterium]|nr:FAD-binding oxidoreductase [Anaerolineaceae bacterium]